jgi:hypothetical protein
MKFTVVWHTEARSELASIWLAAGDRAAISQAANQIDSSLRFSPRSQARPAGDGLGVLTVGPLEVLFSVSNADRLVKIVTARQVPPRESR